MLRNLRIDRNAWRFALRALLIGTIALGVPLATGHELAAPVYADGTIIVTSAADNETADNDLTLREALRLATEGIDGGIHPLTSGELEACGSGCGTSYLPGPLSNDTIVFTGEFTIQVDCLANGALPPLSDVDADNQGDTIEGGPQTTTLRPTAEVCTVDGLTLSGDHNTVRGIRITDSNGFGNGDGFTNGIVISGDNNVVSKSSEAICQIGGATGDGIHITGNSNVVRECLIGTGPTGQGLTLPNGEQGIDIVGGDNNIIGEDNAGNVIAGNTGSVESHGILLRGGAQNTTITDNTIGVDISRAGALGNQGHGINIANGSATIGQGATETQTNVIGSNGRDGIRVAGGVSGNSITNNRIGVSQNGDAPLGNAGNGINVQTASGPLTIQSNVVSANTVNGIWLNGNVNEHLVDLNIVGTDPTGTLDLGNGASGIRVQLGAGTNSAISNNLVRFNGTTASHAGISVLSGGITTISGNTVSDQQGGSGVLVLGGDSNLLSGNTIGDNFDDGIHIAGGTTTNVGQGEHIGNNGDDGIRIAVGCSTGCDVNVGSATGGPPNVIQDNNGEGIDINGGDHVDIGSIAVGGDSDILSNRLSGIRIASPVGTVRVRQNRIEANNVPATGTNAGILVLSGTGVLIGGVGDGNSIRMNGGANIAVSGSASAQIQGNVISLGQVAPNVRVSSSGQVLIGGIAAGEGNTISDGTGSDVADGVNVVSANAGSVRVLGNTFTNNGGTSIDLDANGIDCVNPVSNGGINCPTIVAASSVTETVSGTYRIRDCPNPCRIEVYQVTTDDDGNGEGNIFRGAVNATGGTFTLNLSGTLDVQTDDLLTATATDSNSTSEFGPNLAALGSHRPDVVFLIPQAAVSAAAAGDNLYGDLNSGAGGFNNATPSGPAFPKPLPPSAPVFYSFAAAAGTSTYVQWQNDGLVSDRLVFDPQVQCVRIAPNGTQFDCGALTGLTIRVLQLGMGDFSGNRLPGGSLTGDITMTVGVTAAKGNYFLRLNFHSFGDPTVVESVTVRFRIT